MASPITLFTISVPDEKLQRLKQKLAMADFPNETEDAEPWTQGAPVAEMKRLAHYWGSTFDWRAAEAGLNRFPQFRTDIDIDGFGAYKLHFVHQESVVENAIPLLFVHGWPGSFIEVTKILPQLVDGGKDFPAFHVVAPSLIDFGFLSASRKRDFNIDQHAEACHKLMLALGYSEYVTEGGDLGSLITRFQAIKYGITHIKAQHLSNVAPAEPNATDHPTLHAKRFSTEGNGYYKNQSTKPETVGYFMADSPVGFLGWMIECLHDWVDGYVWTDDELLTWLSIYFFSAPGPAASSFVYYAIEHRAVNAFAASAAYTDVPIGVSRFPGDLILLPKLWNQTLGPVVFEREHERGGHFAAWERPDAIVGDLRDMFGKGGGAYCAVPGRSGFD